MKLKQLLASVIYCLCLGGAMAAPGVINYSGRLLNTTGQPITSEITVKFSFWDSATTGTQLGSNFLYETTVTPDANGLYSVGIGLNFFGGGPVPAEIFDAPSVWLNVNVEGEDLTPRSRIDAVPYAFRAEHATSTLVAQSAPALIGDSFVMPKLTGTALEKGLSLLDAYERACNLRPNGQDLATTNRAVLIIPPGRYDLGATPLILDTEFVDIRGLTINRDAQVISATASDAIRQLANNVQIANLRVEQTGNGFSYNQAGPASDRTVMTNCSFVAPDGTSVMETSAANGYNGTYTSCHGDRGLFRGRCSGTFIGCTAGALSFTGISSGTFIDCSSGIRSFASDSLATGTFIDCVAGDDSFGAGYLASGNFLRCRGGQAAFGGRGGTASGTFTDCIGGANSFGGGAGIPIGIFTHCIGGAGAFRKNMSLTFYAGEFRYCVSGPSGLITDPLIFAFNISDNVALPNMDF